MPIKKALVDEDVGWPKPPPPGPGATIGERVEYTLAEGVRRFLNLFDEPLAELFSWCFRLVLKVIEKTIGPYTQPIIDYAIGKMEKGDPLRDVLVELRKAKGEAAAGILTSLGGGTAAAGLMSILEPFFERGRQASYQANPWKTFDVPTWISEYWRGLVDRGALNVQAARLGYRTEWLDDLMEVVRPRLGGDDLGRWYLRDKERKEEFKGELEKRGYLSDDIDRVLELLSIIPGPADIIRMAVREAFKEDIARDWGLDQDFDPIVEEWAEKVGLDPYWTNKFWRAHWELPSVMMGYEMLHRGEIDETELKALMRALDIMPGWREHLINISYSPYTRVDVRRMYDLGFLDETGVKKAYKEIGYDDTKAENLKDFTVGLYMEEDRDATKTDILSAYFEGVITREFASELLHDIGYKDPFVETYLLATDYRIEQRKRKEEKDDSKEEVTKERELTKSDILSSYAKKVIDEPTARALLADIDYPASVIDLLIAKIDFQEAQRLIEETIKTTRILYINEEIDLTEVHVRLGQLGLPATQIAELLTLWNIEKDRRTERPSVSQLLTFYFNGIIDETILRDHLVRNKYSTEYIDLYVANANYLILEREEKELERQQKEQERLAKAEFRTDRMVAMADLNTKIQEWKVLIAGLKTMMIKVVPPGTKQQLHTQIRVKEEEIAGLNVEIAVRKEEMARAIELAPTLEEPEEIEELKTIMLRLKTEIAEIETNIAWLREEIAAIRTELSIVVEPAEKLAYVEQISLAKEEIAKLQLEKTKLPVVPPTP